MRLLIAVLMLIAFPALAEGELEVSTVSTAVTNARSAQLSTWATQPQTTSVAACDSKWPPGTSYATVAIVG